MPVSIQSSELDDVLVAAHQTLNDIALAVAQVNQLSLEARTTNTSAQKAIQDITITRERVEALLPKVEQLLFLLKWCARGFIGVCVVAIIAIPVALIL